MIQRLKNQINQFFVGKEEVVEDLLICLLAGGHILIEDVPGVGKTTLAKVLAKSIDGSFGRIQFTPDTLPGDVTGISVYDMQTRKFEYQEGPIMNQIVLADEINRTSPKTQSARNTGFGASFQSKGFSCGQRICKAGRRKSSRSQSAAS